MAVETTFSIIKPNAVKKKRDRRDRRQIRKSGLKIAAMKLTKLEKAQCEEFYAEHKARPFFGELVAL